MAAPNLKEIEWAIHELENQESSESRYSLLASLYTCRNEILGQSTPQIATYSEAAFPTAQVQKTIPRYGDSDFLRAVSKIPQKDAWAIMDELMGTLQVVNRRAYESVMGKLERM